jgi:antitoxin YefM
MCLTSASGWSEVGLATPFLNWAKSVFDFMEVDLRLALGGFSERDDADFMFILRGHNWNGDAHKQAQGNETLLAITEAIILKSECHAFENTWRISKIKTMRLDVGFAFCWWPREFHAFNVYTYCIVVNEGCFTFKEIAFTIHAQLPEQVQTMQVISYTDARNSLKVVIDKVIDDQAPTLIHRREGGNAVLLSEEAYASMQETLYLLSNPTNARALMRLVAQAKAGKAKARKLIDAWEKFASHLMGGTPMCGGKAKTAKPSNASTRWSTPLAETPLPALANQNPWWVTCQAIGLAESITPTDWFTRPMMRLSW